MGADAALWYNWLKSGEEPQIARFMGDKPIFGDDKQMVALQAADMLAWHIRRRHERGADESLPVLDILLGDGASRDIPNSMLKTWAEEFRRVPGVSEVQTKSAWHETRKVTRALVESGAPAPDTRYWYLWRLNLKVKLRKFRQRWRMLRSKLIRTKS